jgi:hypothetical protein
MSPLRMVAQQVMAATPQALLLLRWLKWLTQPAAAARWTERVLQQRRAMRYSPPIQ